jgi:hypothetical protein
MRAVVAEQPGVSYDDLPDLRLPLRIELGHHLEVVQGSLVITQVRVSRRPIK